MIEKILFLTMTAAYLITFITRNLLVKKRTGKPIRARDRLVALNTVLSALCFVVTILSTFNQWYVLMGPLSFMRHPFISYCGLSLFGISIIWGWIVSSQLKDSWRVGVHQDQQTTLIKDGVYAYVRNPYFLSYYAMFLGFFLVRPSLLLLLLLLSAAAGFHRMVLTEEAYLLTVHGQEYKTYKHDTGRYIPGLK